ncbi:MAG: GSCFA domain-containing protein [Paludibacteraceae bacterium]|nr:GSCFA domain-containing protein [Paludibacteraceae bacterium]
MFRTEVKINPSHLKIGYEDAVLSVGSCFSENIGNKLSNAYFLADTNPFGVLFNPISIKNSLNYLLGSHLLSENNLFQHGSIWKSFTHSSLFAGTSKEEVLKNINARIALSSEKLKNTRVILLTFGTAWVYEHVKTCEVVANCHKLPAAEFNRKRLCVDDIVSEYIALFHRIKSQYTDIQIIMTVSPIRHWKDGAHENNISKSILLLAVDKLQKLFPFVHYFPAYEILLDELRDYRFYVSDMCHPSPEAVDYIWKRFCETYFTHKTNHLRIKLENLNQQLNHRPLFPDTIEHSYFLYQIEKQKTELKKEYPFLEHRI